MSRPVEWSERALDAAAGFLNEDSRGLSAVLDAVDGLADDAQPDDSTALGSPVLRRLRVGRHRVLYEIDDAIVVIHLGRLG